ncbi:MAG: MATE family efflux transporter [Planctomycetaceae bacterium]|jgi:MATE family multidrug resistance protein|nr:MATE family efflux transporter [Planctomycetaceae bacterium]
MLLNSHWWTRPCGGRDVLRQAVPLIISSGSISLMNFTDRMFLMWISADSMTASMQAGMVFWSAVAIPLATAAFITTFVAQYHGSGHHHRIGRSVWQGIWFGLLLMPVFLLSFEPICMLFVLFGHDAGLVALERTYFFYVLLGCGAVICGEAAAAFFRGQGKMKIEMYNNLFCVALNIVLDYCMIFGKYGFPEWGLAGAAIATTLSQWIRFLIYLVLMLIEDRRHQFRFQILYGMVLDLPLMGRICYFGIPTGIFVFADTLAFTAFMLLIGGLGSAERSATTIAFTLNSFTFMPMNGIGIAVTSMVGNQLGKNLPALARRATMTAVIIACGYTGFFGVAFIAVPDWFLLVFGVYADKDEFAAVHQLTIILMRFMAAYLFFDSCSVIFCSALRGAGDTAFIAWAVGFLAPLYVIACWIGIWCGLGIFWCWSMITAIVLAYCFSFWLRYRSRIWESMRVIEKEFLS